MTKEEFEKYVDCIMRMSLDYKVGELKKEVLIQNLKICIEKVANEE